MRKRSKYKPRPIRVDTLNFVKSGLIPVAQVPDAGMTLQIRNYSALDEIVRGNPTKDHADDLIGTVNMAEVLARLFGHGIDWLPEIMDAQDAVFNMASRGVNGKSFRFTGEELAAVRVALEVHTEQLKVTTVKQMEEALNTVAECFKHRRARPIKVMTS